MKFLMNSIDFKIRDCERGDLDTICRIEKICHGSVEALGRIAFTQYFDLFASAFVLAEAASQVIGFAVGGMVLGPQVRVAWLLDVATIPAFEGHGVGHIMSQCVIDKLIREGSERIQATVSPQNDRSSRMLTKLGFRIIDDIPDYFGCDQRRFLVELRHEGVKQSAIPVLS